MFRAGLLFCVVFWSSLVMVAKGSSTKKRLCVQYEIHDFNVSMIALSTLSGMTQSVCFLECVRHQPGHSPCRGFHFRPKEGVCELLPEESVCMTGSVVLGTTYVHLSGCTFMATYYGINPGPGPLRWFTNLAVQRGALHFQSPLGGIRYVVRVLHKGTWLPGWGTLFAARIAGPDGVQFICRSNIQFINSSDPVQYRWISFSVGDPVPTLAIVAGYWPNGTPLYIIQLTVSDVGSIFPAYYNADSLQIRPTFPNLRPNVIRILVKRV